VVVNNSNFIGNYAGFGAAGADYSNFIGYETGGILILGKGYIGNYLYNFLSDRYSDIWIKSSEDLYYHNRHILRKFIEDNKIRLVINCSGFTGRPNVDEGESKKSECWNLNVVSPLSANTKMVRTVGIVFFVTTPDTVTILGPLSLITVEGMIRKTATLDLLNQHGSTSI